MDETLRHRNPNPFIKANLLSKMFFWWLNPFFAKGYRGELKTEDMYNVPKEDTSDVLCTQLERHWEKEIVKLKNGGKPSLLKALIRTFGRRYMLLGLVTLVEESTKVGQPLLLGGLIRYFTPKSTVTQTEAYLYAMGLSLCSIMLAVFHHPYFFGVQRIGMQIRVACCSLLYKKALRLSNKALGETTTGQIVNLMSNDVNRFDQAVIFLHFLWVGPLQAIAVLIILWYELGPACLAGFGVLILLIPVQGWMGKMFSRLRQKTAKFTDERVRLMNEIITGMRVIKMYCWEIPFGKLVEQVRSHEAKAISATNTCRAVNLTLFFSSGKATVFSTLLAYVLLGNKMGAAEVFVTINLYNAVRLVMTLFFPFAVQSVAEGSVTISRTEKFLVLDELESVSPSEKCPDRPNPTDCGVTISGLTAKWDKTVDQSTLEDVSLEVEAGKLLAVIGPVGAGKSSLLMSILGELPASQGEITLKGKISYAAQQPWVFSASLRQNIVFGQKYDSAKYEKIVKVCALQKDLDLMPHGDGTLIGDRGISLSGGQRARVSLARALYTDADIFLLDDPLSAVDAEVGRHIFEKVVMGYLKDKPRILVTHQLQYLTVADEILILKEGKTMGRGTFDELSQSGVDFSALLKRDDGNEKEDEQQRTTSPVELMRSMSHVSHNSKHVSEVGSTLSLDTVNIDYEPEPVQSQEEEEISKGTVNWRIYKDYFQAGANVFVFILLVLLNLIAQTSFIASDWWLSYWANQEEAKYAAVKERDELIDQGYMYNATNVTIPFVNLTQNVSVFTAITVAVFVFGLLRALLFFRIAIAASRTLHNRMFSSILRSKISFFDTNPVGRILNRFSKDVGHMDDNLPVTFFDFIQCALLILGIVVVAGAVNPWVFIPIIPLTAAFVAIRHYFIRTSRNIKRLEGTSRSPVFSHLSASLQGLQTIRAFNVQEKFVEEFDSHQDLHSEAWFLFIASSRWLAVRLDWLCAIFVACVAFCSVLAADNLDAGLVGLSLTYAMTLMGMFQWAVRQSAEVENQMVSVERVLEYSNLPAEAPLESDPNHRPPSDWPSHGVIKGKDVGLSYNGPLVLKHINFTINAKEKVGIVGRTGAGKSSLLTTLFRLVEPEGTVLIDQVDISKIGLHDLRNKISIIPQDPTLFTGSVRRNLDPFEQHEDQVLWSALEEVQLKSVMEELPDGLEWKVSEGGINFSVGQRQLLCLARAILRKNKILVIDEATANVDPRTDALIQETIRDKFAACTVLTIAHRLHTIMDSDRVMVMDEGSVVAFDDPYILLTDKTSHLYKMVEQTGRAETDNLTAMAKAAHDERVKQRNTEQNNSTSTNNGIHAPVTIKLNDLKIAPKASPESTDVDRVSKQQPTSLAEDRVGAANQIDRSIPNDTVANGNVEPLLSKEGFADEDNESTEQDKLLKTGTISI